MLELPHGYTYSAHPIACAAALASLHEIQTRNLAGQVKELSPYWQEAVHSLKDTNELITDIRNFGYAAGITMAAPDGEPAKRPYQIAMEMWNKGFYVRYGGDTIQLAPPFIAQREEIDSLINALGDTLRAL